MALTREEKEGAGRVKAKNHPAESFMNWFLNAYREPGDRPNLVQFPECTLCLPIRKKMHARGSARVPKRINPRGAISLDRAFQKYFSISSVPSLAD